MNDCKQEFKELDCDYQHLKYYQLGYRESILTLIHGENKVWEQFNIDVDRYSNGSARRVSYNEGWQDAILDYKL